MANLERVVLDYLANRLPASWTPNRLTAIGVAGSLVVLLGYLLSNLSLAWLWLSNFGLFMHWFGDSLDGTVARVRKIERPRFGFYLDQVVDTIGNLAIGVGVAICPLTDPFLALIALSLYSMLSIQVLVRTIVDREFSIAVGRFGPTELRLAILAMNLILYYFGGAPFAVFGIETSVVNFGMLGIDIFMFLLLVWQLTGHVRRLAKEDPPKTKA